MDKAKRQALNTERLKLVSPSIRAKVQAVLTDMEEDGFEPLIAKDVWRSPARQLELFRRGVSKAKWGFHCATTKDGKPDSLAADIVDADLAWSASQAFWLSLGGAAARHGLRWGGFWGLRDPQIAFLVALIQNPPNSPVKVNLGWDVAHVQVSGLTILAAKAGRRP